RIEAGGAARGNPVGREGDRGEKNGGARERDGIPGTHVVEGGPQGAREAEGEGDADDQPGGDRSPAAGGNETNDVVRASPERGPNPELAPPLRDRVRHDAVEPDGGDEESDSGEAREEPHQEDARRGRSADELVHRRDRINGHGRVDLPQARDQRG